MSPLPHTAAEDGVEAAYGVMLEHVAGCDRCRAIRLKHALPETENGVCPRGEYLIRAHRHAKRRAREEETQ